MAETTTTTGRFFFSSAAMREATRMRSAEPTLVPRDDGRSWSEPIVFARGLTWTIVGFTLQATNGPFAFGNARRDGLRPSPGRAMRASWSAEGRVESPFDSVLDCLSRGAARAFIAALANGNMGAADFVRPGHVFPLIARDGGVLMRSGHTEAAVDLCRLAGLPPVGVICELANDDGTVMTGPQIADFAAQHGLKMISVANLIAYRQAREKLVERVATFPVKTEFGDVTGHAYVTPFDSVQHFAFVMGGVGDGRDVPTRLHRA
mgnify:CR=1 FL=1